jgi:hypothetical protein
VAGHSGPGAGQTLQGRGRRVAKNGRGRWAPAICPVPCLIRPGDHIGEHVQAISPRERGPHSTSRQAAKEKFFFRTSAATPGRSRIPPRASGRGAGPLWDGRPRGVKTRAIVVAAIAHAPSRSSLPFKWWGEHCISPRWDSLHPMKSGGGSVRSARDEQKVCLATSDRLASLGTGTVFAP